MVDLFFVTCRENTTTGYSALIVKEQSLSSKSTAVGESDYDSKEIFKAVLQRVPSDSRITVHLSEGERLLSEVESSRISEALRKRGHPYHGLLVHSDGEDKEEKYTDVGGLGEMTYNAWEILSDLMQQARAAAWNVRLNENAFVPGASVSTEKAQTLHQVASQSGFSRGALRLFLSEYGMISTKEVTQPVYKRIRKRLSSDTVAEIYNERYAQKKDAIA